MDITSMGQNAMTVSTSGRCQEKMLLKAGTAGREKDFARSVRSLVYGLWKSEIDLFTFLDTMVFTLERNLTVAWYEGAKTCGVQPSEMTEAEMNARRDLLANQYQYLLGLADEIVKNSREKKGKLGPLNKRTELWTGRWREFYYAGMVHACGDQRLKWRFSPLKEHCSDCLALDGLVFRASTWKEYNLLPRSWKLECRGLKCGCSLSSTDEPVSPGVPPIKL